MPSYESATDTSERHATLWIRCSGILTKVHGERAFTFLAAAQPCDDTAIYTYILNHPPTATLTSRSYAHLCTYLQHTAALQSVDVTSTSIDQQPAVTNICTTTSSTAYYRPIPHQPAQTSNTDQYYRSAHSQHRAALTSTDLTSSTYQQNST